ncbi:MAG: carbohydrate kinase [Bacteroidales bacterium]|nr:carbohydrate kinase [Bacteroidales bacterium]
MRKIFTIGETVFDIIFQNQIPVAAKPGGAMLNTAVSLGRMNVPVSLLTEFADDKIGIIIENFLQKNNVSSEFIYKFTKGQTAISIAFLDDENNAAYSFYKNYPKKRLASTQPVVNCDDIVLFGSFYSLTHEVRKQVFEFVKMAAENNAIIIYDPNIRKPHKNKIGELMDYIFENIEIADIIRASDEDFNTIFDTSIAKDAYQKINEINQTNLIYTQSDKGVQFFSNSLRKDFEVPKIKPLSTIGAGDSFNAGIIYALIKNKIKKKDINSLTVENWDRIINSGIEFATEACLSYDNYIPESFAAKNITLLS